MTITITIKTFTFIERPEAEVFAAEQRSTGAETWITYNARKGGRYVVTVRRGHPDHAGTTPARTPGAKPGQE